MLLSNRYSTSIALSLALGAAPVEVRAEAEYEFELPEQALGDALRAVGRQAHVNIAFDPTTVQGRHAAPLKGRYSGRQAFERLLEGSGLQLHATTRGSFWLKAAPEALPPGSPAAYDFDLPRQGLAITLQAIMRSTGKRIAFDATLVAGKSAAKVSGHLGIEEALRLALNGTGLQARVDAGGGLSIHADDGAPSSPAFGGVQQLSEILVVAQVENTYTTTASRSATRTDTDLLDVPQSLSIVTRKLLDDQQAQTLDDALINAAGMQVSGSDPLGSTYSARGFDGAAVMVDGMGAYSNLSYVPIWAVDSVEVLKGPEAMLAGSRANFGGTINLALKQPQRTPISAVSFGLGSYGMAQTGLDMGGPLADSRSLSYRLVAQLGRNGRNAAGNDGADDAYLAPSLLWSGGGSSLLLGMERTVRTSPPPLHTVISGTARDDDAPLRVLGARDDSLSFRSTRSYYRFEQEVFDARWRFRSRGEYQEANPIASSWTNVGEPDRQGNLVMAPIITATPMRGYAIQNDLNGQFSTGPVSHEVLLGNDFRHQWSGSEMAYKTFALFNVYSSAPLPSVGSVQKTLAKIRGFGNSSEVGYLIQDQLSYGDWRAQLALRRALFHNYGKGPDTSKWLPNLGLVYRLTPDASVYANSAKGYKPNTGRFSAPGSPLPPVSSQQYEAGFKIDLRDRRLSLTAAAYRITVSNMSMAIPNMQFYRLGPGRTSRGVEVELRGQVATGLDVSATLAHTVASNADRTQVTDLAKNSMSLWGGYQFQRPALRGWSIGGGLFARSQAWNASYATDGKGKPSFYLKNPGQARVDAHVVYTADRWSINAGIRDVFDRRLYAVDSYGYLAGLTDPGRTYLVTGKFNF